VKSHEPKASPSRHPWWATLGPSFYSGEPEVAAFEGDFAPVSGAAATPAAAASLPTIASAAGDPGKAPDGAYDYDMEGEDEEWSEDDHYLDGPERPLYVPRWVMRVWHRIAGPSSYPDRSASLDSEPGGRLNKLDLWSSWPW